MPLAPNDDIVMPTADELEFGYEVILKDKTILILTIMIIILKHFKIITPLLKSVLQIILTTISTGPNET